MTPGSPLDDVAAPPPPGRPVFRLQGIRKRFGATEALRGVDVELCEGEFVALLGPNGAGKSTLIRILDGVERQDSGEVVVDRGGGLGIVHQDLGLVDYMTVAENLFLGRTRPWLRPGLEVRESRAALRRVGLDDVHPLELVSNLSLGQRTMLAVAKLLHSGASVVVVDEVTAGLHPADARWLVAKLRDAAHAGSTVLMVTHKLREVDGIADRYIVLLDGEVRLDCSATDTSLEALVDLLTTGRRPAPEATVHDGPIRSEVVCQLVGVEVGRAGPVDLAVRAGAITGVTGTLGSGIHEVAYVLAGLMVPAKGEVRVARGVRRTCVPAHRESEGVFPLETEEFNLTAGSWGRWRNGLRLIQQRRLRNECEMVAERLEILPRDLDAHVGQLSGGNQQKTLLGRALIDDPDLIVLCEPTRGVDVATRREIYSQVRAAAAAGAAVFVASSDLEDLTALASDIGVLGADGRIERWVTPDRADELSGALV